MTASAAEQSTERNTRGAIAYLKHLLPRLAEASPEARIEFACTVFEYGLYHAIINHDYVERGVSGRDFDTCFEMGDGDTVVHGIMRKAIYESAAIRAGIESMGEAVWPAWEKVFVEQEQKQAIGEPAPAIAKAKAVEARNRASNAAYNAVLAHSSYAGIDSSELFENQIKALISGLQIVASEYGVEWPSAEETEAAQPEEAA
jgi:hypothetical protein